MALELPFGIKPVNPVPVEFYSGPYSGNSLQEAINAANSGIPTAVRFPTMEANLIVNGSGAKYWYNSGIGDEFLSPLVVSSSGATGGSGVVSGVPTEVAFFGSDNLLTSNAELFFNDSSKTLNSTNIDVSGAFYADGDPGTSGQVLTSTAVGVEWSTPSNGSNTVNITTFTGNSTLTGNEGVVICDCSFGPITITLPAANGFTGRTFVVKKKDSSSNVVTVNTQLNQTIDGALTRLIYSQYESMTFVCDGSEWFII